MIGANPNPSKPAANSYNCPIPHNPSIGVRRPRFVGSGRQACLEETIRVALTVDFALVVLGREIASHREFRLTLDNFRRVRGGRDRIAHLREAGCKEGVMGVVGPRDPREGLGRFGILFGAIAGATKMAPEALRMARVEAHRLSDPVDAFLRL